jgi:hypothetical protein
MKTLLHKKCIPFLLFVLVLVQPMLAQVTLVKSFNLAGSTELVVDLPERSVEFQQWNEPLVRVQMQISAENVSDKLLRSLIAAGRYNLTGETSTTGQFVISAPNIKKNVKIGGADLKDELRYKIFVPQNVHAQILDASKSLGATF